MLFARPFAPTAGERFRRSASRWWSPVAVVAVAVHAIVLFFVVIPTAEVDAGPPNTPIFVHDIVPETPLPPRERARPAEPVVSEAIDDVEITIRTE